MRFPNCLMVLTVPACLFLTEPGNADEAQVRQAVLAEGQLLFQKHWEAGKPATRDGDGLGPMFNAVSCDSCHNQGGVGGGGSIDFNVDLLSLASGNRTELKDRLKAVHPAFIDPKTNVLLASITLHRFGASPSYSTLRQLITGTQVPLALLDKEREELQRKVAQTPIRPIEAARDVKFALSQRQTPALFGAGLIDSIPDETLQKLAAVQPVKFPGITGRVPQVRFDRVGRFGWRGQTEHLADFVLGACANELGLQVPGHAQPIDPIRPEYQPTGLDLTQEQCDSITAYVASFVSPKLVMPEDSAKSRVADFGRTVFQNVGCSACHVETVGPATQIYSDLLLHDMGPSLADPVAAEPEFVQTEQTSVPLTRAISQEPQPVPQRGYSGGNGPAPPPLVTIHKPLGDKLALRTTFKHVPTTVTQEWRTPPLWGVASSAPYLHDGRAATVLEAIVLHGGEAKETTGRFLALPTTERLALLEFLSCLQAPSPK